MMKLKIYSGKFLLHYGISIVLVLMMVGIAYLLQVIEIRNKVPVDVIYCVRTDSYIAYVHKTSSLKLVVGNLITVDTTGKERLCFKIRDVREESTLMALKLSSVTDMVCIHKEFSGNTKLSGYIFTNKVKLWNLVFSKL